MKIFSKEQIQQWDDYTSNYEPIDSIDLMERASYACFKWLDNKFTSSQSYTIFCGSGNNGGDGLAIARMLLLTKCSVKVFILVGNHRSINFKVNLEKLLKISQNVHFIDELSLNSINIEGVVIDALVGSGLTRSLSGKMADLVHFINQTENTVISIDLPTGLFSDSTSKGNVIIRASYTVCFQAMKLAFLMTENNQFVGNVQFLEIGLHQKFYDATETIYNLIDSKIVRSILKPRNQFTHKYNFGHSILFAGSKNMMGAALLCAKACLRAGTGLVTLHTEEISQSIVPIALPEAITTTENNLEIILNKKTAIAIGPGLENSEKNKELLIDLLNVSTIPLVIDATALTILSKEKIVLNGSFKIPLILTPHTGEFEKLFGKTSNDFETMKLSQRKAIDLNCTIILKGHHTLVTFSDGDCYFNSTGNAGMATAGSGDVLTGILTGLLAQGYSSKNACILGIYLHGLAGDLAAKKISQESLIATDIIDSIGEAFKSIQNSE
jgi:NAD(P)H-hydrate epimerase